MSAIVAHDTGPPFDTTSFPQPYMSSLAVHGADEHTDQFYIFETENPREIDDMEADIIASTNENLYQRNLY